ncbi:MAG TPA: rod shape-determining protein MreC [Polyangia bacterium]
MVGTRRRLRGTVMVLALLALALLMLRQSARAPGRLGPLDRTVMALLTPLQSGLARGGQAVKGFAARTFDLSRARAENEALQAENRALRAELLSAKRAADETLRLQKLVGLRESTAEATLAGRVIAVDASPHFRIARITLDRGTGLVRRGMAVITPAGVVGRIESVAGSSSSVQLAVDPQSTIDVVIPRTGGRGLLVGKPGENGYRCEVQYLARGEAPKPGDAVVTSGLGGFPRDLPVGTVSRVLVKPGGLFQEVEVTPAVDFVRLAEVLVIVAPSPAAEPESGRERANRPRVGLAPYH